MQLIQNKGKNKRYFMCTANNTHSGWRTTVLLSEAAATF